MRKSWLYLIAMGLIAAVVISGCAAASVETDEPEVEETEASEPTVTATRTATEPPTVTPTRTKTATPTKTVTPKPTRTPTATFTASPVPTRRPTSTVDPTNAALTASAPTLTPTSGPTTAATTATEFVPQGASVWQLDNTPYETSQTAECPAPLQHDFYGLYLVQTIENAIQWRGQDSITYTLAKGNPNVYFGGGGSVLPGYNVNITVIFNSSSSLTAVFVLVDQNVAGCQHTYKYNGTFQFMR